MNNLKYYLCILIGVIFLFSCSNSEIVHIEGITQGTYYSISYFDDQNRDFRSDIDSILKLIDETASVYNSQSIISKINRNEENVTLNEDFINLIQTSRSISEQTFGYFDITIAPLINLWRIGNQDSVEITQNELDSVRQLVGWKNINIENGVFYKQNEDIQLNMNAIAQGYTVQKITNYFHFKGLQNFIIDIGGEVFASGTKAGQPWRVGIEKPAVDKNQERHIEIVLALQNQSLVTSGSYRKYKLIEGQRYSHIIDAQTGYPTHDSLLSVTILHDDATFADAYATALMAMGYEKALSFAEKHPELGCYFIYSSGKELKTFANEKIERLILQ